MESILSVILMSADQKTKAGREPEARFSLVIIVWEDHQTASEWYQNKEEALETFKCLTLHSSGWLVHEDDKFYVLASMISVDDGRISMLTQILKGTVVSKTVICP